MKTKKRSGGAAAKLIKEGPARIYTGDLNDHKALKAFRRGEVVYDNTTVENLPLSEVLAEQNRKLAARKELTKALSEKAQAEMPVEDKIRRKITNTFKKFKGLIRRKK